MVPTMYFPTFARSRGIAAGARPPVRSLATVNFHNGESFTVVLDDENGPYLDECLRERRVPGTAHVVWFETVDGCLVGVNLDQVNLISRGGAGLAAPGAGGWDRDHVILHFADKQPVALPRIDGDEIDRLRGATLLNRRRAPYHSLPGQADGRVSINLDQVTYITLPASWLDDE